MSGSLSDRHLTAALLFLGFDGKSERREPTRVVAQETLKAYHSWRNSELDEILSGKLEADRRSFVIRAALTALATALAADRELPFGTSSAAIAAVGRAYDHAQAEVAPEEPF